MVTIRSVLFSIADHLTRSQKRFVLLMTDVVLALVAVLVSFQLVSHGLHPEGEVFGLAMVLPVAGIGAGLVSNWFGIPQIKLNAFESSAVLKTGGFAAIMTLVVGTACRFLMPEFPLSGTVLFGLLLFLLAVAVRMVMLYTLLWVLRMRQPRRRVLIYGAGNTGTQLAAALQSHASIVPVAFVDDNKALHSMTVAGLRVMPSEKLESFVQEHGIERIILAMPSESPAKLARLARKLGNIGLAVQTMPSFAQLVGEEHLVEHLLDPVPAGHFLGRQPLGDSLPDGTEAYSGRSIMVSGAGGSIGAELCRQLLACHPKRIVLYEVSEFALYSIEKELRERAIAKEVEICAVLGSVTDSRLSRMVLADHQVEVVLHAAAYKHVNLVETNPIAGLANNVLGTRALADAAHEAGVQRFILISTDKAVRPTNVMGASKRLAELVVQDMARRSRGTVFSMVRFGNVLGSSGSVIPLFKEQIARGGPVTLTDQEVTRYFMTIAEAARLVLLAGSFAQGGGSCGGDVFVLDMGTPVRIRDLAVRMIKAAGYSVRSADNPDGDIEIKVIGLQPGEKMHEELLIGEGLLTTPHSKILRARENCLTELQMASALQSLRAAVATGNATAALDVIRNWVEGYQPPEPVSAGQLAAVAVQRRLEK